MGLKEIKTNGLLAYSGGMFGRVIKIGQKNFGIEDVVQQNIDIGYIANALKLLDANQSADIIKIDRPVNLDGFAKDIFDKLSALRESEDYSAVRKSSGTFCRSVSTASTSATITASSTCPLIIL